MTKETAARDHSADRSTSPRVLRWLRSFSRRLKNDGPRGVWIWLYGHCVPTFLRIPVLKYHRLSDRVYLGPQHGKLGKQRLSAVGVAAAISLRCNFDDREQGLAFEDHLALPTLDLTPPSLEQLHEGAQFIRRAVDSGKSVYIHCQKGLGRAPTMAAAFLISEGGSLEDAVRTIRAIRPFTMFTGTQIEQLEAYERRLRPKAAS